MTVLVDTSVWSLAYRRDTNLRDPLVEALREHLERGDVVTTGMVYLELLRGFTKPESRVTIEDNFTAIPFLEPTKDDYAGAADLSLDCRRAGVQLESVDALIAQLCIANDLTLLTGDADFAHAARHVPLTIWNRRD
jgi:predicted nucleic acid-binding protein